MENREVEDNDSIFSTSVLSTKYSKAITFILCANRANMGSLCRNFKEELEFLEVECITLSKRETQIVETAYHLFEREWVRRPQ